MTSTTQRNDADELRKELLATIHASRELGPEMDDTLTDRFMERMSGLRPAGSYDQAGTRARLSALLQSARGSDSAGDNALAEDFIAGIQPPRRDPQPYAYGAPPAPMPYGAPMPPAPSGGFAQVAPMLIVAIVFIAALAVSGGHLWWIIFFLPAAFGWNRRNRYQRRLYRDQRRDYYRNGRILNRDEVYPPLPPSQQRPPEIL